MADYSNLVSLPRLTWGDWLHGAQQTPQAAAPSSTAFGGAWGSGTAPAPGTAVPAGVTPDYPTTPGGTVTAPWQEQGGGGGAGGWQWTYADPSWGRHGTQVVTLPEWARGMQGATARFEFNGQLQEDPLRRAVRGALDMVRDGKATSFQHALSFALANMASDWRRRDGGVAWGGDANGGLGFDTSQFANNEYGEKYDPHKTYYLGGALPGGAPRPAASGTPVTPAPVTPAPGALAAETAQNLGQAWTYNQGTQGGTTMVAPPLGSGPVQGAAAAVAAGEAQPGAANPQYNRFLQNDKAARMAALMDRLGLGTPQRQRSVFGQAVGGSLSQLLDPWMQTQGLAGGNVADNYSDLIDKFVGYFNAGGGGMGAVANDARNAAGLVPNDSRYAGLEDPELIALLQGFQQLAALPLNPWLQRAYGNLQDDSVGQFYAAVDRAARAGSDPASFRYLPWLQQNPLYGFLTGR